MKNAVTVHVFHVKLRSLVYYAATVKPDRFILCRSDNTLETSHSNKDIIQKSDWPYRFHLRKCGRSSLTKRYSPLLSRSQARLHSIMHLYLKKYKMLFWTGVGILLNVPLSKYLFADLIACRS